MEEEERLEATRYTVVCALPRSIQEIAQDFYISPDLIAEMRYRWDDLEEVKRLAQQTYNQFLDQIRSNTFIKVIKDGNNIAYAFHPASGWNDIAHTLPGYKPPHKFTDESNSLAPLLMAVAEHERPADE